MSVKNEEEADEKIIEMSNNNYYTVGNLLDYAYYKKKYKLIAIESSLCDYSHTYISVTGNIRVKRRNAADTADIALGPITQVIFKNCAPFKTFVDETGFINIAMPMCNLIEYSDKYSDTSGSLWRFKGDEIIDNEDVTNDNNALSFKYKANLIGNTENNGTKNGVKIAVPLKYLSNFWRSLEMPLINCEVELS